MTRRIVDPNDFSICLQPFCFELIQELYCQCKTKHFLKQSFANQTKVLRAAAERAPPTPLMHCLKHDRFRNSGHSKLSPLSAYLLATPAATRAPPALHYTRQAFLFHFTYSIELQIVSCIYIFISILSTSLDKDYIDVYGGDTFQMRPRSETHLKYRCASHLKLGKKRVAYSSNRYNQLRYEREYTL